MHDVRVQLAFEPLVRVELAAAVELVLQVAEHLLGRGVVQTVALAAHGLADAEASELVPPPLVLVLPSHVRVQDRLRAGGQSFREHGGQALLLVHVGMPAHVPGHDLLAGHVVHGSEVGLAARDLELGDVGAELGEGWIGNGVLDGFLEDESPFGEFLRTPVSKGGVEPLVVGPPHVVVEVAPQLLDRGVAVPVHELLLQQPVRRFDHGVVIGVALARQRSFDAEHVEQLVDPRVAELAAPVGVEHLDVRQREAERGERAQYQACVPGPPGGMADDAPVRQVDQQTHVRPVPADADIGKIARRMRVRGVAVEPAVQQVREPGLVGPRPVRFGPSARACARHAPFAHDAADASPGRGDALPFQGGLDLPGAVAFAAVAPDRAHVAGDRIRTLRPGMPGHPVVGGAGNAQYPALRRYRVAGGVGPYHACLRANTGAACSETSTSISNRLLRLLSPTGSFRPGVRLSAARVEPLLRMPCTQRCRVDRAMSYSALISRDGLPLSCNCTI